MKTILLLAIFLIPSVVFADTIALKWDPVTEADQYAVYRAGGNIVPQSTMLSYIRANGSTTDNNLYTKTYTVVPDFTPTNKVLQGTGEGGVDIGALPIVRVKNRRGFGFKNNFGFRF